MRRRIRDIYRRHKSAWPQRVDIVIVLTSTGARASMQHTCMACDSTLRSEVFVRCVGAHACSAGGSVQRAGVRPAGLGAEVQRAAQPTPCSARNCGALPRVCRARLTYRTRSASQAPGDRSARRGEGGGARGDAPPASRAGSARAAEGEAVAPRPRVYDTSRAAEGTRSGERAGADSRRALRRSTAKPAHDARAASPVRRGQ